MLYCSRLALDDGQSTPFISVLGYLASASFRCESKKQVARKVHSGKIRSKCKEGEEEEKTREGEKRKRLREKSECIK